MKTKKHPAGKARPYPVLGNGKDFNDLSLRTSVEILPEEDGWTVRCEFQCDSEEIRNLVASGDASYIVDLNCPAMPGSRRNIPSGSSRFSFKVLESEVFERISLAMSVIANRAIHGYLPAGLHDDYRGFKNGFNVMSHEVIAEDEKGIKFFELDGGSDSFLKIRRSMDPHEKFVCWEESHDYFWIVPPQAAFDNWMLLKKSDGELEAHAATSAMVLPALIEAIRRVRSEDRTDLQGENAPKWARSLLSILREMRIDDDCEEHEAAQKILKSPTTRLFAHLIETNEEDD